LRSRLRRGVSIAFLARQRPTTALRVELLRAPLQCSVSISRFQCGRRSHSVALTQDAIIVEMSREYLEPLMLHILVRWASLCYVTSFRNCSLVSFAWSIMLSRVPGLISSRRGTETKLPLLLRRIWLPRCRIGLNPIFLSAFRTSRQERTGSLDCDSH